MWQRTLYGCRGGQDELACRAIVADAKFAALVKDFGDGGVVCRGRERRLDCDLANICEELRVNEKIAFGGWCRCCHDEEDGGSDNVAAWRRAPR